MSRILLIAFCLCAQRAYAQQVPDEHIREINEPVQQAIDAQVQVFKDGGRPEVLRLSDMLIYPFGIYQPVLSCTLLRACVVELEPGEQLISMIAGDDQRWLIDPTATGAGGNTPLVSVKPTSYNITTNLVLSTDRRVYHITLDSPPGGTKKDDYNPLSHYTRHIKFYYPEAGVRAVSTDGPNQGHEAVASSLRLGALNYRYEWRKDKGFPWEPLAVFDDGHRVYIKSPQAAQDTDHPLLAVGRRGEERMVNYTVQHGYFVVEGLFAYARLVVSHPARRLLRRTRQVQRSLHIFAAE